jgi:NAD(P)-dependent dehydrogenase (short-subunit alcohol dehydrogenase family)
MALTGARFEHRRTREFCSQEVLTMTLHGKVGLVIGASRGIGKAIAERLGRDGASIVVNYYANRPASDEGARAEEVTRVIEKSGGAAVVAEADVADADQLRRLFKLAEKQFGGLDILVTNAAAWRFAPIAEATDQDFDLIFNTNARAAFVAMHEAPDSSSAADWSRSRRPSSTSRRAAIDVISFVIDASQNSVSPVIEAGPAEPLSPKAPWYSLPFARRAAAASPGTVPALTAACRR